MKPEQHNGNPFLLEVKNLKKHFPVTKGFLLTKVTGTSKL
jgi:hypothetical protein